MLSTGQNTGLPNFSGATLRFDGSRLPQRIFLFFFLIDVGLVLLDAIFNYGRLFDYGPIRRMCNIAREDGIATWFMVVQTLLCGLTLGLTFFVQRSRYVERWKLWGYGFLSFFFVFLSADDASQIHERLGSTFKLVHADAATGSSFEWISHLLDFFPSYAWQLAAMPFLAGSGLFMLFFLLREFEDSYERKILWLAVGYMVFAQGLDFIEGLEANHALNIYQWLQNEFALREYTVLHFAKSLEEFLEMFSMTLFLSLFLRHLIGLAGPGLRLMFREDGRF